MKLDVLLTDGDYKNTYAILRALKEKDFKVGILYNDVLSLSFFSKLVDKRFHIKTRLRKNPNEDKFNAFKEEIVNILKANEISVFMPVGNISYKFASFYKPELQKYCNLALVDDDIMATAQDKSKTFEFAQKFNVPIPRTFTLNNVDEINDIAKNISYPCVIKKTNYNESGVIYCNNKDELIENYCLLDRNRKPKMSLPIVQEYIIGPGMGYYGLYDNGKCVGYFMHQRIHEFPITGGASTLAKSDFDPELKILGEKLLMNMNWHGVAMVEFKKDLNDGKFKLMEINPKFWGSFELSHKSGINFAYLNYLVAMQQQVPESRYENNVHFRWTLPYDIVWYRYASKQQRKEFRELKNKVKLYSDIHWDDPLTVIYNSLFTLFKLFKEKRYPHGHIQ
jgi:predicted ATP-grasp superfamily ATP-dependent carboligase